MRLWIAVTSLLPSLCRAASKAMRCDAPGLLARDHTHTESVVLVGLKLAATSNHVPIRLEPSLFSRTMSRSTPWWSIGNEGWDFVGRRLAVELSSDDRMWVHALGLLRVGGVTYGAEDEPVHLIESVERRLRQRCPYSR